MNTAAQTLIHLDGVTKVFFTDEVETHALAGIHLEIKSGEYIAIAGPSGCGKSTLLSILGLLDSPTDGKYILNGTFRRDGSSKFGPNNRWGNFGAGGAAWLFSEEGFIKNTLPALSYGKLGAGTPTRAANAVRSAGSSNHTRVQAASAPARCSAS